MPSATVHDGRILVTDVEYRDRDSMKLIPGSSYKGQWTVPLKWPVLVILKDTFGDKLTVGKSVADWAWTEYSTRVEPALEARTRALEQDADAPGDPRLWPLQRTAVDFLVTSEGAVLEDHMGMGKTATMIATLEMQDAYPALIVCPNSVKPVWAKEFAAWAPQRIVRVVQGGMATRRKQLLDETADVFVINWEGLRGHSRIGGYGSIKLTDAEKVHKELNRPWKAVVADEAHKALKPRAKQTRALWAIGASARVRYAMTGTPIDGHTESLWSLLHFVAPEEWPSRTKFIDRYCLMSWNTFGGMDVVGLNPRHADELHKLIAPRTLRRPKSWLNLPDKLPPSTRYAEMTPKQAKAYKSLAEEYVADVDGGMMMAFSPMVIAGRLSQLASASIELDDEDKPKLCLPSNKINVLLEALEELGDDRAVVFMSSAQLLQLTLHKLLEEGISVSCVVGGQNGYDREAQIQSFIRGDTRVILLTYGAGSEGLDGLQHICSTQINLQRSWSMIENRQAAERLHRPGQKEVVTTIDIVAPGSVEEHQIEAVLDKDDRMEEIVQDHNWLRKMIK